MVLRFRRTDTVIPKRDTVVFGETQSTPLDPVECWWLLEDPQPGVSESGTRSPQRGKFYVPRGTVLKDGDLIPLPEGDFRIVGAAQLNRDHPMSGRDFGWIRYLIEKR